MTRRIVAIFALLISSSVCVSALPSYAGNTTATTAGSREPSEVEYAETYTVWVKCVGDKRYHGTSGLSYYDATRLRDSYTQKGCDAYIKKE
jgi:hypothetical protein